MAEHVILRAAAKRGSVTRSQKILLVDDEAEIRSMLNIFLGVEDFEIVEADSGKAALREVVTASPDLVVLDLGLPDMDGIEVLRGVRKFSNVPVIVLTVRSDDQQVVEALSLGADDYVTKPFRADVLLARIQANLRQRKPHAEPVSEIYNGGIRMNLMTHQVYLNGNLTAFTPKEFSLLQVFVSQKGKMLTHKHLLREVWGPSHTDDTQYLRVYIGQVREKLSKEKLAQLIVSESGIGYRMDVAADELSSPDVGPNNDPAR